MVRQYVQRGDIVWNFPGGGIELGETPEEACIREVKEETGYEIRIIEQLQFMNDKYTFSTEIIGGNQQLDKSNKVNEDIIEIAWISLQDQKKFDAYTRPIIDRFCNDGISKVGRGNPIRIGENIKAIIFDLDNTLLDRSQTFLIFSNKLINKYFTDLTVKEQQKIIEQIIVSDQDGYKEKKQMFIELLEILPWDNKPSVEELLEFYSSEYVNSAILMDDALEILQFFKTKYKIGLITNGKIIIQYGKLDKLNLREYFDAIVVSEEAGIKKPHKGIFEIALKNLNLRSEDCIYIGDHPVNDMDGADKAGMKTIWIKVNQLWKDELTVRPLKTITKLNELFELI